jgi:hypothetical protein
MPLILGALFHRLANAGGDDGCVQKIHSAVEELQRL